MDINAIYTHRAYSFYSRLQTETTQNTNSLDTHFPFCVVNIYNWCFFQKSISSFTASLGFMLRPFFVIRTLSTWRSFW